MRPQLPPIWNHTLEEFSDLKKVLKKLVSRWHEFPTATTPGPMRPAFFVGLTAGSILRDTVATGVVLAGWKINLTIVRLKIGVITNPTSSPALSATTPTQNR